MIETLESGAPKTPFLNCGDTVRIEMRDEFGATIFGVIEQKVMQNGNGSLRWRQFLSAIHR